MSELVPQELGPQELGPFDEEFASRAADARGRLSGNDERILRHLQQNLDELPFHTSDSLSQAVGVSRAAVVRFANKLGYTGFAELQQAARQALRRSQESPLSRFSGESSGSLLEQKAIQDSKNLLATEALVREAIGPAAQAIAGAQRVYLVAARRSYGLVVHLDRMLGGLREGVRLIDPGFPDEIADAGRGDVVIACLFRRYSRLTVDLLGMARAAGAEIVMLTDGRGHDFAVKSDHVLVAVATSPSLYDSMVAPLWVLESLIAEVAAVDPDRSRGRLTTIEDFTEHHRLLLG
jgi:DNA-binding MurR/RpiR family transcriptional regulator